MNNELPLTGWPSNIVPNLINMISEAIKDIGIKKFYIGRTNDLSQRKSKHGCNNIIAVYQTDGSENAMIVEQDLLNEFFLHEKCNNDSPHCGGSTSDEDVNYVYIALWYK
ncbi:MAG: hypothetical protein NTU73_03315 [Ignavibacteriae bacterium]|nr:hypothetical protein [Ignavibacteriota bacterium]